MRLRDRLGIDEKRQETLAHQMQGALLGFVIVGIYDGNVSLTVNAGVSFGLTYLPAILERDYDIPLDAGLTFWITAAVFLHGFGTIGPYKSLWWWDHVTHTLSSSVVAAAGYITARAFDEHSKEIYLPPKFMFAFILLFVMAFGVFWEVLEFGISESSKRFGTARFLTQYGVEDTVLDLVFDMIGGVIVAVWGTAYLTDFSKMVAEKI